jgi:hypothetical protein
LGGAKQKKLVAPKSDFLYHYRNPIGMINLKFPKAALSMPKLLGGLNLTKTKPRKRRRKK